MLRIHPFVWGLVIGLAALLNIVDVLPDWATIAAILTLPFVASANGGCCALRWSAK
jgi:hypothetical protein